MVKNMTTEVQTTVKYRYIVTDLLTNQILAEIPFTGVSYERALKSAGKFQGNISINLDTKSLDLYNSTMPGKTGLYVMRNDECVWGGIIWSREYSVTGQEISVSASEFTSYLHHRRIWKTFLREFDGVKVTRYNASLLKVRLGYGSRITINSGSTVELIFDEARAYNYRGHYKVVGDYVNASSIYVEDIPVEAFTGNAIAFDGDYREDETTKTQTKTYTITNREMVKGKKDVTLTTKVAHGLLPGDSVAISGIDAGTGLVDYIKTTGDSTPLNYKNCKIYSSPTDYGMVGTTKYKRRYLVTYPTTRVYTYKIEVESNSAIAYMWLYYDGLIASEINTDGDPPPILTPAPYYGMDIGSIIRVVGLTDPDNGNVDLSGSYKIIEYGEYGLGGVGAVMYGSVKIKVQLPSDRTWVDSDHFSDTIDNVSSIVSVGNFEVGQKFTISNTVESYPILEDEQHEVVEVGDTYLRFEKIFTSKPILTTDIRGDISRVVHYKNTIKNVSAADLNKSNNIITAVPTYKSFVVLSNADSSISSNVAQTQAKVQWDPVYAAVMHANTDTYDYVRLLLGHVFTDFSRVPTSSSFLGTDITNGIRKVTYNEANQTVRLHTGFVESAYSKEIKRDSFTVSAVTLSKNLATATFSLSDYTVTAGSVSGTNVTFTSSNSLIPGDVVSVDIPASTSTYEVVGAVVTAANATHFTVTASGVTGSFSGTGTAYKHHDFAVGDVVTFSGIDADLGLGKNIFDITTRVESVPTRSKITFSVPDESEISLTYVNANATGKYYVKLALPTPYDQFYVSYTGGLTDVGTYVTVYGNDISVNGSFPIKKISPNKDYIEYYIPDGTETKAIEYLSPDSTTIVFGAHGMIPGNTITVRGLADKNYDGTFTISDIPNLTSLEYQHELPAMQITNYRVKRNPAGTGTYIWLRLSGKPTYGSFVDNVTKVKIQGVPILDNDTYTIYRYLDPEQIKLSNPNKLKDAYYIQLYLSGNTSIQLTPPLLDVPIDIDDRLYGTVGNVNSATYVANGTKGTGTTTFVTTAAHGLSAGDTIYLSNVGNVFTNKSGVSSAYTWLTGTVKTIPTSTRFTMNQNSLYRYKYKVNVGVAKTSVTLTGITGATVRNYKTDSKILTSVYATAQITTMSDFYSNQIDQRVKKVINRAYNKETQEVRLTTQTNHGFSPGEVVTISGVDDPGTIEPVFDGSYVLIGSTEYAAINPTKTVTREKTEKNVLVYKSGSALKSDIGVFLDPNKKDTDPTRRLISSDILDKNADGTYPATAVVEPIVFGATYGSYTGNTDLEIEFSTYDYSGAYMRGKSYRGHELVVVADALDEYADKYIVRPGSTKAVRNVHGFEYRIDCYFDKDTQSFRRVFVFIPINFPNEPVHGEVSSVSRFGADKIVFEYPGNISEITLQESAEEAATRFWMVGSDGGTGTDNASKTYVGLADTDLLSNGWPIFEQVETNDQLDFIADITDYAKRYLVETKPPIGTFDVSVNGSYDPVVNSYSPGDWCSLIVRDQFISERLTTDLEPRDTVLVRKIAGYSVQVPDGNGFPEQVKLTLIPEWDVDKR
jgi:hypothetical protein